MDDAAILALYWARSERAITETDRKYGSYCRAIARNLLSSREDAEECVSDTWWKAWNAMPPSRPECLQTFLGRITRNLSLDRIRRAQAKKRPSDTMREVLSELEDCAPSAELADQLHLTDCLNRFLEQLSPEKRRVFLLRYWYACSIPETARQTGCTKAEVKSMLTRVRKELRDFLQKEDITV